MVGIKIDPEEQLLTQPYMIRHLELLAIHSIMDIIKDSSKWFTNFLTKNLKTLLLTQEQKLFVKINNWLINYTGLSLENLTNKKYTNVIKIKFGELIF